MEKSKINELEAFSKIFLIFQLLDAKVTIEPAKESSNAHDIVDPDTCVSLIPWLPFGLFEIYVRNKMVSPFDHYIGLFSFLRN